MKWLTIATVEGASKMGEVLGYVLSDTEQEAESLARQGGWWLDELKLDERPDDLFFEVMSEPDFRECYGNRMPLRNDLTPEPKAVETEYERSVRVCADHYAWEAQRSKCGVTHPNMVVEKRLTST